MNPDAYMPLYGNDIFAAIEGHDDTTGMGYFRAIWHYWHVCHTSGLPNDDTYLRKVCRIEPDDWLIKKPVIFGKWFKLDSVGLWQNKRSQEEWKKSCKRYNANLMRGKLGSEARWGDASSNTPSIPQALLGTCQSESESESVQCNKQTKGGPPTLTQVKAKAGMVAIPASVAEDFWHHFESVGWIDKNGHQIVRWESKLMTWKSNVLAKPLEQAARNGNGNGTADKIQLNQELQRILPQISQISNGAASDAMGQKFFTPDELKRLGELRERRDVIRKAIGAKY